MELILIKLNSGEHMIAEVVTYRGDELELKNHCMVFPAQDKSNSVSVLPTFNLFDADGVMMPKSQIVYSGQPNDEIREQYEAAFGSGIVLPSTQILRG